MFFLSMGQCGSMLLYFKYEYGVLRNNIAYLIKQEKYLEWLTELIT